MTSNRALLGFAFVAVAVAVGASVACTTAAASAQRGVDGRASGRLVTSHGISLAIPPSWHGRFLVSYGNAVFQAADFRLPTTKDADGKLAIRQTRGKDRVFVLLSGVGNRPGTSGFDRASVPPQLSRANLVAHLRGPLAGLTVGHRRFSIHGRSFFLLTYVGRRAAVTPALREVNRLLSSLRVQPLVSAATWTRLHRPLNLPKVARGARCPRSPSSRASPAVYFTLGSGPAYPVLGTRNGIANLTSEERRSGSYWHKTLWAIRPSYRGPLLVRGRRLDSGDVVGFSLGGGKRDDELRLVPGNDGAQWRYAPSDTVFPAAGCYAFQIDGTTFSSTVVLLARLSS